MQVAAEDMQTAIGNMETAAVGLKNGIYWAKKGARILKGTGEEELWKTFKGARILKETGKEEVSNF